MKRVYWQVDVKTKFENDQDQVQKIVEKYLINAFSATEAETKFNKEFEGNSNSSVEKVVKSKIIKTIKNE